MIINNIIIISCNSILIINIIIRLNQCTYLVF